MLSTATRSAGPPETAAPPRRAPTTAWCRPPERAARAPRWPAFSIASSITWWCAKKRSSCPPPRVPPRAPPRRQPSPPPSLVETRSAAQRLESRLPRRRPGRVGVRVRPRHGRVPRRGGEFRELRVRGASSPPPRRGVRSSRVPSRMVPKGQRRTSASRRSRPAVHVSVHQPTLQLLEGETRHRSSTPTVGVWRRSNAGRSRRSCRSRRV